MIDRRIGKIKVRRGTDSQRKLVTFEEGELVYSIDKKCLYIGNGNEKGGILVSNRNYVKDSLGVPPVVPNEVLHGDIVHDKSNSKTYITKCNEFSCELILIADLNCAAGVQIQIDDLNNRINQMAGCLAPKPPPVIPPVPTKLSWYDEPVDISINLGDTITLSSSANGGIGTVFYNWRRTDNIPVLSNTNKNLVITNALDSDIATYYCVANNDTESITSRNAIVSLKPPTVKLTWTTEPSDTTVNLGEKVLFYSNATGFGTITYTWKRRDGNTINSINSNLANLTIDSSVISDIATYYCIASNTTESITSKNAVLDILANSILAEDGTYVLSELSEFIDWEESDLVAPTITTQPRSLVTTSLVPVTFEVTATGSEPLSYQWRINGVNVAGETNRTYTVTNPTKDITGITCVASNIAGSVVSNSVNLIVGIKPTITIQPVSQTAKLESSVTFSVVAGGSAPISYQWRKDGVNITGGATNSSYTINSVTDSDFVNYSCYVSNNYGNTTSETAKLNEKEWTLLGAQIHGDTAVLNSKGDRVVVGTEISYGNLQAYSYNGTDWVTLGENIIGVEGDTTGVFDFNDAGNRITRGIPRRSFSRGSGDYSREENGIVISYEYDDTNKKWIRIGQDLQGESSERYSFGSWVSMNSNGNVIAVYSNTMSVNRGLFNSSWNQTNTTKKIQVYSYNNTNWIQLGSTISYTPENEENPIFYVPSINDKNDRLFIYTVKNGLETYSYNSNNWVKNIPNLSAVTIIPEDPWQKFYIIFNINKTGDRIIIADSSYDNYKGKVMVYSYNGTSWIKLGQDIIGANDNDYLGKVVCMNAVGDKIVIFTTYNTFRVYSYNGISWIKSGPDINVSHSLGGIDMNDEGNIILIAGHRSTINIYSL